MQVELPAIAARGACFPGTNSYPFGRSCNNTSRSSFTRSSQSQSRNARQNQKKSAPKAALGGERGAGASSAPGGCTISHPVATTPQSRGHHGRSRYSGSGRAAEAHGGRSGQYQRLQKKSPESPLPPRLRADQNRRSTHHHTSKKANNGQAKTNKVPSVKNASDCPSSAPPPTPPTCSDAQTQKEVESCDIDSIHDEKATADIFAIHQKMSSSADSGHCEEFTSSYESGVFDHLNQGAELVSMAGSSVSGHLPPQQGSATSDELNDDEVFLDAYSNLPSEASSVYMTPESLSRDPESSEDHPTSPLSVSDPLSSVDSQKELKQKLFHLDLERREVSSASSEGTVKDSTSPVQEGLESSDSHVTIMADGVNKMSSSPSTFCFQHASLVFDAQDEHSSQLSEQALHEFRTSHQKRSKDISNLYIGEIELEALSDGEDSAIDFEVRSLSPSLPEEDGDSGCATSIGSPDKTTASIDFTRPGLFHLPDGLPQEAGRDSLTSENDNEIGVELCKSFELSHSREEAPQETGKDEWPDLSRDECYSQPSNGSRSFPLMSSFPPMRPYPPLQPVACPPVNGYVHPTPQPPLPPLSSASSSKPDSDPSQWIRACIRQHQQAVYHQHAVMMGNGFPPPPSLGPPHVGPPIGPPPPLPLPPMLDGPTGFPGFYPPPLHGPPVHGPGYSALPQHQPRVELLPPAPPIHHTLPLSPSPPASNSDDKQASPSPLSSPSPSPSPDISQKHQLCSTWVLWYDRITGATRGQMSDYKNSLNNLSTIDSIEDFWGTYNNVHPPSCLDKNANYHFFKEGIYPLWEDEANKRGGKWVLTIREDPAFLDKAWLELLLMVIGGGMEQFDDINGIVVSRRKKGDRIAVWTRSRSKEACQKVCVELVRSLCFAFGVEGEEARQLVKELADGLNGVSLAYMYHSDSLKSGASYSNEQHIKLKDLVHIVLQSM